MNLTLCEIEQAANLLATHIHHPALQISQSLSERVGATVYLKPENLQKTGSFKIRGALNKLAHVKEAGVVERVMAASAGNHAQGVALAASRLGLEAMVVMPERAPLAKLTATAGYGAKVLSFGSSYDEAYQHAKELADGSGSVFVHAFDDPQVIAGQGTVGLEILQELPETDVIVVPIGGGGLIAGIALAAKSLNPSIKVVGVVAEGSASAKLSFEAGEMVEAAFHGTIADGIAVKRPGEVTLPLIMQWVDDVVSVSDSEIAEAILFLMERTKMVVEGAGAASVAALSSGRNSFSGQHVVSVVSGGNMDMNVVSRIIERGMAAAGRYCRFHTTVRDQPGGLLALLRVMAELRANVVSISHDRLRADITVEETDVELLVETKGEAHAEQLLQRLAREGFVLRREDFAGR